MRTSAAALLAALAALAALVAPAAGAQPPDSAATVEGVVFDSLLTMRPLAGAEVWVEGTARAERTDAAGRFVVRGLEPGRRRLAVSHPSLDAIGVTGPVAEVALRAGAVSAVSLATPAPATAYARLCGEPPRRGVAVIAGVVDRGDGAPASGAVVWARGTGASAAPRVLADAEGRFRLCGVPVGRVDLLAADTLADGRARLALTPVAAGASVLAVATLRMAPVGAARAGVVVGRVATASGLPVRDASVDVAGAAAASARTDADGRFTLVLPAGAEPAAVHALAVRAVGFEATALRVDGTTASVSVALAPAAPELERVLTRAAASLDLTGFEARRTSGNGGRFITAAEIEQQNPGKLSQVLKNVPGIVLTRDFSAGPIPTDKVTSHRSQGSSPVRPQGCQVNVFVDGAYVSDAIGPGGLDAAVLPRDILGIEVYQGFANVPPQFQRTTSGCGTVLIWTKREPPG